MPIKITAKAKVQLTVEVPTGDLWGGECAVDQVYTQAAASAKAKLRAVLSRPGSGDIEIVGEPKIIGIITEA